MIAPLTEEQIKSYYTSPIEEEEKVVEEMKVETMKKEEDVVKEEGTENENDTGNKEEVLVEKQEEDCADMIEEVPKEEESEETVSNEDEYIKRILKSAVFRANEPQSGETENPKESKKNDVPMMERNVMNVGLRERGPNALPFVPIYVPVIVVVKEKEKKDHGTNPKPAKFQQVLGALIPLITTLIYFYVFFWKNLVV